MAANERAHLGQWLSKRIGYELQIPNLEKVGLKRFPVQYEIQSVAEAGVNLHGRIGDRLPRIREIAVDMLVISPPSELNGKRVALLKEVVLKLRRVAVFWSPTTPSPERVLRETEAAA